MASSKIATLMSWCADNHIQIDSRLQIIDGQHPTASNEPSEHGLSVYSREELNECGHTLVYIPKSAVLSVKSCFFSQHIAFVPYGHGAHLSLALALYGELLLGSHSRWFNYLQTLPRETVDIAVFWGVGDVTGTWPCTCSARGRLHTDDPPKAADKCQLQNPLSQCPRCVWLRDNQNAKEWLQVTEMSREQVDLVEELRQYYLDIVEPTLHAASTDPGLSRPWDSAADARQRLYEVSFPGFCRAYSLVSTRAFWVDAYHGLAMVPIADAFNHANDNHVQMESDYDVCVECGSLAECEHDREIASTMVPAAVLSNIHPLAHDGTPTTSEIDYLEMRTVRPIPPFSQVFNTYGSLSNAALLSRYGFTLPENEHDTVQMVLDPSSVVRNLLRYVGPGDTSVGEDEHVLTETSVFGHLEARNTFREQQQYSQGILDSEAIPSLSVYVRINEPSASSAVNHLSEAEPAWEKLINRILRVFTHVAGMWSSDSAWDDRDEGLVFNLSSTPTGTRLSLAGDRPVRISHDLVINSDGKLSHNLWLFCILVALFATKSHLGPSIADLTSRVEASPEAAASLTEFKAMLINVQGCVERLRCIRDGDSTVDSDGGNQGSTFSPPPNPHLACPSPRPDYDTGLDNFAPPTATDQVQREPVSTEPKGALACVTSSNSPHGDASEPGVLLGRALGSGPRDPEVSMRFLTTLRAPLTARPTLRATGSSYPEVSPFATEVGMGHATGYGSPRDRSRSAERGRPSKRVRRCSGSIQKSGSAQEGKYRKVRGASGDDGQMTPDATYRMAILLARVVVSLCRHRYRPLGVSQEQRGVGMTAAELGDLLDETPECMRRTRSALVLAISERSVVESCEASWGAILGQAECD